MYEIKLANGTILTNLELNGNNYISPEIIEDSVFENNLDTVEIFDGENTVIHTNMILISNRIEDGHSWFILSNKNRQEITDDSIIDIQLALTEIYELLVGGN